MSRSSCVDEVVHARSKTITLRAQRRARDHIQAMLTRSLVGATLYAAVSVGWSQPRIGDEGTAYIESSPTSVGNGIRSARTSFWYSLRLAFVDEFGLLLDRVRVIVRDLKGETVLRAESNGPFFFAAIRPGVYRVLVEHGGLRISRTIEIPAQRAPRLQYFFWPAPPRG